jgi:lipid-binding SYLF domain-containing protein
VGATLNGAELNQDHGATKALYGSEVPFTSILEGQQHTTEAAARHFVHTINEAVQQASR